MKLKKNPLSPFFLFLAFFEQKFCQTLFWCDRMKISTWFIRIPVWQFDIFLLIPLWHEICTISFILCTGKKNRKRILEFLFSSTNWRRTKLKSFFFSDVTYKIQNQSKCQNSAFCDWSTFKFWLMCYTLTYQKKYTFKFWHFFR